MPPASSAASGPSDADPLPRTPPADRPGGPSGADGPAAAREGGPASGRRSDRVPRAFALWVDLVGGFLVLTDPTVVLGGGSASSGPDHVVVEGSLLPQHLRLRRDSEGTVRVEPVPDRTGALAPVAVGRERIDGPVALADGQQIVCEASMPYGRATRMTFHQPPSLSFSARLSFPQFERIMPYFDGLILMGSSLVIGPQEGALVRIPHWPREAAIPKLTLVAREGRLTLHAEGPVWVDDRPATGPTPVTIPCHVAGPTFSLSLAPLA